VKDDTPSHSLDLERAILGSILIEPSRLAEVRDRIGPDDFFRFAHADVFRRMLGLDGELSPLTIASKEMSVAQLSALTMGMPRGFNLDAACSQLIDFADRRRLQAVYRGAHDTVHDAPSAEEAATILIDQLHQAVRLRSAGGGYSLKTTIQEVITSLDEAVPAVTTGMSTLDQMGAGFRPGELTILAGRPSHGKTALALHIAASAAAEGTPVWFASLEMTRHALATRWLSSNSTVPFSLLRGANLSQTEFARLSVSIEDLSAMPIRVDDHASMGVGDLRRSVAGKEGLLVVDYLQLLQPPASARSYGSRVQEVGAIARGLKAIAHDCKVSVLALSQLNRAVEQRQHGEANLSDLRESGEIEQTADVILFVSRPWINDESELQDRCILKVAKHRNGPCGRIELCFDGSTQRFRERTSDDPAPRRVEGDDHRMRNF